MHYQYWERTGRGPCSQFPEMLPSVRQAALIFVIIADAISFFIKIRQPGQWAFDGPFYLAAIFLIMPSLSTITFE